MKKITSSNYKKDKLYRPVARAVAEIMQTETVVSPVTVLMRVDRLNQKQYEDWRFGRIPYLERVLVGNLGKINRIPRILRLHAESLGAQPLVYRLSQMGQGKTSNYVEVFQIRKTGSRKGLLDPLCIQTSVAGLLIFSRKRVPVQRVTPAAILPL